MVGYALANIRQFVVLLLKTKYAFEITTTKWKQVKEKISTT